MTGRRSQPPDDEDRPERPDLRLVPLAAAQWVGTWAGARGTVVGLAGIGGAVAVAAVAAVLRRSAWLTGVAVLLAAGLGIGWAAHHRITTGPVADLASSGAEVRVVVVIATDASVRPGHGGRPGYLTARGWLVEVATGDAVWRTRAPVLVVASGSTMRPWQDAIVGATLSTRAQLQLPVSGADLTAVVRPRGTAQLTAAAPRTLLLVERVRRGLRAAVQDRPAEPRALVPALVLGDTSALTPSLTEDFRRTGLTHLTAVSGANLTLLLAFLLLSARWLGIRGWWLRGVGLFGVLVFVALCRTEPSVLRAAAMGLVALAALGVGARRAGPRNLSLAVMVLLLADPLLSWSPGFALSVLASGGIIWWARRWTAILSSSVPRLVAEAIAVPLAAHLATLAFVAHLSGSVSVVGLLANVAAGPFVGPTTVLGFLAAGLSLVSARLAGVAGFFAALSAQPIVWVAHAGARLPGASLHWPATPAALLVLGAAALCSGAAMAYLLARRWLCLLVAGSLVACLGAVPGQPGWPPRGWVLVACDVGQGDGLAVRAADGAAVVIDAGPDPAPMRHCLDQLRVREVPLLIVTHFHADHVDGLAGVLQSRRVQRIWVRPSGLAAAESAVVREVAAARGIPVEVPPVGAVVAVGAGLWEVLGPIAAEPAIGEDASAAENDASLVVRATVRGVRILLPGDAEPAGQQAILASGADVSADVLKVPHHGSAHQDPGFLAATRARVAVASAGADNDYGHPAPRTTQLLTSLGMTVLRTDRQGSVAITERNGALAAVTQRR